MRLNRYLPAVIALISISTTLLLWHRLVSWERSNLRHDVEEKIAAFRDDSKDHVVFRVTAFERMARRLERSGGPSKTSWEQDADLYIRDYESIESIELSGLQGHESWVVPARSVVSNNPADTAKSEAMLKAKGTGHAALSSPLDMPSGEKGFYACIPLNLNDGETGYITVAFKSRVIFKSVFQAMRHLEIEHYAVAVSDGKKLLYESLAAELDNSEFTTELALPLYGTKWRLRMGLNPAYLSVVRSPLPSIALSLGFIWSVVLTSAVYFAQAARRKGRDLESANLRLKHEIIEREEADKKVVRSNRLYSVLSKVDEAIVRIREPETLFREACRICVEEGQFIMAWVGMKDPETRLIKPVAYWGVEDGYLETIRVSSAAEPPEGRGPTGSAVREGRYFVCADIENDPKMELWRDSALKRGYRSSASFPLFLGDHCVGALTLYASEPYFFDEPLLNLLHSLTADLSFALESAEAEKNRRIAEVELAEYREHLEDLVEARTSELTAVNKELEAFTYSASHDLQEPLRIVSGYVQLLARRYKGKLDSDADEFIAYAVDGATRMQKLISDLLSYSRVGRKTEFSTIDTEECVRSAIKNLKSAIDESGATVSFTHLPKIEASAQLTNLFTNLIGNAIKYRGEARPLIRITAERIGRSWQFSVTDNGIGIEPRHHERIFVLFQRLHAMDEYPGTGIGLSLCKKIVENHGGRIWVESTPGEGSTFYFNIPDRKEGKHAKN